MGDLFCPLGASATDVHRIETLLLGGKVPPQRVAAVRELLAWQGDNMIVGVGNAVWLLLIPYGFAPMPPMPDATLRQMLARACDVRAAALLAVCPPSVRSAVGVLRCSAQEIVADYDYHVMNTSAGRLAASIMLATVARAEQLATHE